MINIKSKIPRDKDIIVKVNSKEEINKVIDIFSQNGIMSEYGKDPIELRDIIKAPNFIGCFQGEGFWYNHEQPYTHSYEAFVSHYGYISGLKEEQLEYGQTHIFGPVYSTYINMGSGQDLGYSKNAYHYQKPPIMEDKSPLTIEEKKELYKFLESKSSLYLKYISLEGMSSMKRDCAPLFHTSIDNVPVWEFKGLFFINTTGKTEEILTNNEKACFHLWADGTFKTASTREACERWIADNRMVKVSEIDAAIDRAYESLGDMDGLYHFRIALKEGLSKLTGK